MRYLLATIFLLYSEFCLSIGWEILNKESAAKRNVEIAINYSERKKCHEVKAEIPQSVFFDELGKRRVKSVGYRVVNSKEKGWQLGLEGTEIPMSVSPSKGSFGSVHACLAGNEFEKGVIVIYTSTPKGSPPMFIIINVKNFA